MKAPSTSPPYRPGDVVRSGHEVSDVLHRVVSDVLHRVVSDVLHRQADAVNDQIAAVHLRAGSAFIVP